MSSVQSPLLHSMKLESLDNLVNLSNDSSEGAIPNVSLATPVAHTLVSNSKAVSTQSLSSLLLVHLVILTSLGHRTTQILMNIPMSWSAPHFLDLGTN
jgi:hypothetical protein